MMGQRIRRRLACLFAAAMALAALSPQLDALARLPEEMVLSAGTVTRIPASSMVRADIDGASGAAALNTADSHTGEWALTAGETGEAALTFRLLGLLPLRTVKVSVQPTRVLVPGGQSVGVALNTQGVVVVGSSDLGRTPSPARLAGLKSGDVIRTVDGEAITSAKQLSLKMSNGAPARLGVVRDGVAVECDITPVQDSRDGQYRLGAWVRDSTAGVGTLTFYDPVTGEIGALGHAITDVDTGVVMPVGEGELFANRVVAVTPSKEGAPGELTGDFFTTPVSRGRVTRNARQGVFGTANAPLESALYPGGLPVADRSQTHTGAATLLTTVEGGDVGEYACEIVRLSDRASDDGRSMVVRVTDEALLARTGGIVQGMSGSPLIQDGRIIGAITHVMVNDPAMGYAIDIGSMLDAAG